MATKTPWHDSMTTFRPYKPTLGTNGSQAPIPRGFLLFYLSPKFGIDWTLIDRMFEHSDSHCSKINLVPMFVHCSCLSEHYLSDTMAWFLIQAYILCLNQDPRFGGCERGICGFAPFAAVAVWVPQALLGPSLTFYGLLAWPGFVRSSKFFSPFTAQIHKLLWLWSCVACPVHSALGMGSVGAEKPPVAWH